MAVPTQWRFLSNARINRIVGRLAAKLEIERPLVYLDRLNLVPALDDELTGRFTGKVFAADIVADEQVAMVYESLSLDVVTDVIPNLKFGQRIGQRLWNRLKQLAANPVQGGEDALAQWERNVAQNLVLGVRQRMNALACAMMLDSLTYNRLGVQISGASWGMPSNLKVTPGTAWATAATATPINDILSIQQVAQTNYNVTFTKMTLSSTNFWEMVATTEFASKVALQLHAGFAITSANLKVKDTQAMRTIAQQLLGMEIVIDDATYNTRNNAGTITSTRVLPANKVLLSRTADERDNSVMDFANGQPMETEMVEELQQGAFGPVAYYTPQSHDANPPGWNVWAVARAFPRKFVPEATAVLTVG